MQTGKILVFSAPSGSGKTTLVHYLMSQVPGLHFSISATSRSPRPGEVDGRDYYFLSPDEFRRRIAAGDFIEHEEVYHDKFYGTLRSEVDRHLEAGHNVVLDIDVKGALNVKHIYGQQALLVFIQPPSIEALRERLIHRGTDSLEVIADRVGKASYEMTFAPQFDQIVINDKLEQAQSDIVRVVTTFLRS